MLLFKSRTQKSSCDAARVKLEALTEEVEALRSQVDILDDEQQNIVRHQDVLHAQLNDLENIIFDLGAKESSFPVYIDPNRAN
jgi:chromosome segregation ATPase